jgi:hypothetical protein
LLIIPRALENGDLPDNRQKTGFPETDPTPNSSRSPGETKINPSRVRRTGGTVVDRMDITVNAPNPGWLVN